MENKGKTYVMGDIHGCYRGLKQCLERSGFNKEEDTLIQLGDVVDGWSEVYECVEELLTIKNLISIKGNHDDWFNEYLTSGSHPCSWLHGGYTTLQSYAKHADREVTVRQRMGGWTGDLTFADVPPAHNGFFAKQHLYYIDSQNRMFVHGGWNREMSISEVKAQQPYEFYWDRSLVMKAMSAKNNKLHTKDGFEEIFVGHTATINWNHYKTMKLKNAEGVEVDTEVLCKCDKPMTGGGLWNLDTGGGWYGRVTIMNVETKEYWQSDVVETLYPEETGRH